MSKQQGKRTRRVHTREFKAETVKVVKAGGRGVSELARELGLADSLVRAWMRQADVDVGRQGSAGFARTCVVVSIYVHRVALQHGALRSLRRRRISG